MGILTRLNRLFLSFIVLALFGKSLFCMDLAEIGKVTGVFQRGKSSIITAKLDVKLPQGALIFIEKNIKAVVQDMYNTEGKTYDYEIVLIENCEVTKGAAVFVNGQKEVRGDEVFLKLERKISFIPKKKGKVIEVFGNRAHIDKGSLQEVRDRDVFAVYDSSGRFKGRIETRGVGDNETLSKIVSSRKEKMEPGDTIIHLGTRRYFGIGLMYGYSVPERKPIQYRSAATVSFPNNAADFSNIGDSPQLPANLFTKIKDGALFSLFWTWKFPNGWGIDLLGGNYSDYGNVSFYTDLTEADGSGRTASMGTDIYYSTTLYFPVTIKKNFFFPGWFSPYAGVGTGWFSNKIYLTYSINYPYQNDGIFRQPVFYNVDLSKDYLAIFPDVGIELFSSSITHIIFDAKYIPPWYKIEYGNKDFSWDGWIISFAATTNW